MYLNIIYSLDFEEKRIKYTLDNIKFYNKNKYKYYLTDNLKKDFKINIFKEYEKQILNGINSQKIFEKLKKYFNKNLKKINLYLTKYGTLGSYEPPNEIIININTKRNILQVFVHELIHLYIHDKIEKNKISHFYKEALVDNIFLHIFPNFGFKQNIDKKISLEVENTFKKNNFDYIKSINEIKKSSFH